MTLKASNHLSFVCFYNWFKILTNLIHKTFHRFMFHLDYYKSHQLIQMIHKRFHCSDWRELATSMKQWIVSVNDFSSLLPFDSVLISNLNQYLGEKFRYETKLQHGNDVPKISQHNPGRWCWPFHRGGGVGSWGGRRMALLQHRRSSIISRSLPHVLTQE